MNKKIVNKKNTKGNSGKLLEGALVGAVLGVVAGILITSEAGKKIGTDIKKLSGDFYRYMAPQVKKLKNLGESEYNTLVDQSVKKYAKAKKLSIAEEKILVKEAKRSWNHIKKHL
ncbi:MAG: YtxH domain-containing protein [Candidatus Paceibacterota bacterium]|jgi:gas vesicle protein